MYEDAVRSVGKLETVAATVARLEDPKVQQEYAKMPIRYMATLGVDVEALDKLNMIHITGTKGKGSTCAYCESILRHKGYKTGFFSSPHVLEMRERIRLDGKPISREKFGEYFLQCYRALASAEMSLPDSMSFFTVMAMYVFLKEKVDVAIIEVEIGGQYDSTNFIRNPVVCGISSVGIDHTSMLGTTKAQIAWHKAGIFKPGVPAVTNLLDLESMNVLIERARERGCPLYLSKRLPIPRSSLGIKGDIQVLNASLALQLTAIWLRWRNKEPTKDTPPTDLSTLPIECPPLKLTPDLLIGLSKCFWPGRCQTLKRPGVTYYVDGAHTEESVKEAVFWFKEEIKNFKGRVVRVLMFNLTGERIAHDLLRPVELQNNLFHYAIFCPNMHNSATDFSIVDVKNLKPAEDKVLHRCISLKEAWDSLRTASRINGHVANGQNGHLINGLKNEVIPPLKQISPPPYPITHVQQSSETISFVMPSIQDSLVWLTNNKDTRFSYSESEATKAGFKFLPESNGHVTNGSEDVHIQVLVTGSLYLVGGVMHLVGDYS